MIIQIMLIIIKNTAKIKIIIMEKINIKNLMQKMKKLNQILIIIIQNFNI